MINRIWIFIASLFICESMNAFDFTKTYAIQNIKTSKNLRPFEAKKDDGNRIILYNHHWWKCMTWEFIKVNENSFILKNFYTKKTFQSSSIPENGVILYQQEINNNDLQVWEFIKQDDNTYSIKLKDNELYITISSEKTNSEIILMPYLDTDEQKWKLVEQKPWF